MVDGAVAVTVTERDVWWPKQRDAWRADAACLGVDPDIFFPAPGEDPVEAMAVCRRCPVQAECLEVAIAQSEQGVWGGTTGRERERIRRSRRTRRS